MTISNYCDCCGFTGLIHTGGYVADGKEAVDDDAANLSYVGQAAYECLRKQHNWHHNTLWNVTHGSVISIDHTPNQAFSGEVVTSGHSDWLPKKMGELITKTEIWCDVTSLSPPDGLFLVCFKAALKKLHEKDKPIIVRFLVGNIIGMPTNCHSVIEQLTQGIPTNTKLKLWVGAWRKGVSWNHSKIIAVDGHILHTGGHNLWDGHYLQHDPVHDVSMELEGQVTQDGHYYANEQWKFIELMQGSFIGYIVDKLPDNFPMLLKSRVTVSEFPAGTATIFPPMYDRSLVVRKGTTSARHAARTHKTVMITMGRYGTLTSFNRRPSDDAIVAIIGSAKKTIRLEQFAGPVCIPGSKVPLPGCTWPKLYLNALGKAIWTKGVDVEIVLSNPTSIPGGLKQTEACYGNGWICVDVAAEIIKSIKNLFPEASGEKLKQSLMSNLRVCFLRNKGGQRWEDGMTLALHSKHMIVDETAFLIGSQNLYVCDLAEWGVLVDDKAETKKAMQTYWNPMWTASYTASDCNIKEVMQSLDKNRDGEDPNHTSEATRQLMADAQKKKLLRHGKMGSVKIFPSQGDSNFFDGEDN